MIRNCIVALGALALSPLAVAQVSYGDGPLTRGELQVCMERDHAVRERQARLADDRAMADRESAAIARDGEFLADMLRNLDRGDRAGVAEYNARSDAHNRRVADHNRFIADLNARTALVNGDARDVAASCGGRLYWLDDRDALRYYNERSTIR